MYTAYWELEKNPFEIGCDPFFYYPSESFQSVLLKLRYTIESRHGSALLRGPAGTGKSMILTMLEQQLIPNPVSGNCVTLRMPQLNADEILCYLAESLDPEGKRFAPPFPNGSFHHPRPEKEVVTPFLYHALTTVENILLKNAREKRHSLLIIEEAQQIADPKVYPLFKSLLGLELGGRPALSIIFAAASPAFPEEPHLKFIENCIETVADLDSLNAEDTTGYILFRLKKAGCRKNIFTDDAFDMIYQLSGGLPRKINRICDLALLVGYAERMENLDAGVIQALNHELLCV